MIFTWLISLIRRVLFPGRKISQDMRTEIILINNALGRIDTKGNLKTVNPDVRKAYGGSFLYWIDYFSKIPSRLEILECISITKKEVASILLTLRKIIGKNTEPTKTDIRFTKKYFKGLLSYYTT
ncbi:hypothetical protein KKG08_01220 [Patescibacteria group bacterium]|nr:hypothetical protein [Patescibacteria group bacterium]